MYYVMELISDPRNLERKEFWQTYAVNQQRAFEEYQEYVRSKARINEPTFGKLRFGMLVGNSGNPFFTKLVNKTDNVFHTYVAHVSETVLPDKGSSVEMSVGVLFHPKCPVYTNMGIERGYRYLMQYEAKLKKLHSRISTGLHSFTAQVLLLQENSLVYMMTDPDNKMTELMLKAFPNSTFYGTSLQYTYKLLNDPLSIPPSISAKFSNIIEEYFLISQKFQDTTLEYTDQEWKQLEDRQYEIENDIATRADMPEHIRIRETAFYVVIKTRRWPQKEKHRIFTIYDPTREKSIMTIDNLSKKISLPNSNENFVKEFEWLMSGWGVPWGAGPYITLNAVRDLAYKY